MMTTLVRIFYLSVLLFFASSCVSKKKHLAAVDFIQLQSDSIQLNLDSTVSLIGELRLQLAEEKGANRALLATQDKMQDRIIRLDDEIEQLQQESASKVENMDGRLQEKEEAINSLQAKLDKVQNRLGLLDKGLKTLSVILKDTLKSIDSTVYTINTADGRLIVALRSDFLFYSGSTTKMHSAGEKAVQYISQVLLNYPLMEIEVVGHTDNSSIRRSSISTKWEFSAMRAATLVHLMTRQHDLSTNRIVASGKGEFAPRASNTTEEGRNQNDRMEIMIMPAESSLIRDVKKVLEE